MPTFTRKRLTAEFTGPPCCFGFQENLGSAAPVQLLLGAVSTPTWFSFQPDLVFMEPNALLCLSGRPSSGGPVRLKRLLGTSRDHSGIRT
jgi:hypothetical protein